MLSKIKEALHKSVFIFEHLYGISLDIEDVCINTDEVTGIVRSRGFDSDLEYEFPIEYIDLTVEQIDEHKKQKLETYRREEKEQEEKRKLERIQDLKSRFKDYNAKMKDCEREYKSLTGEELR